MFLLLIILISAYDVSSEGTTNDGCQSDYRLTRLEVSVAEQISRLRDDIKEALENQKTCVKEISLHGIKNQVPNSELHGISYPKNCAEVNNITSNGVYKIKPGKKEVHVFCDLTTDGGGWTVIQNRISDKIDFYKGWNDYKMGFGDLQGDLWLGLETIHQLTNAEFNELLIELEDFEGAKRMAKYSLFIIGSEEEGYSLKALGKYSGDAGNSLNFHTGQKFTTKDKDHDMWTEDNCAVYAAGAWWYTSCQECNLNGRYLKGNLSKGNAPKVIYWGGFRGWAYSLKTSRMLIRPLRYKK